MCHGLIIEDEALAAMDIRANVQRAGATSFDFADTHRDAVDCALERRPEMIISDVLLSSGFGPDPVRAIHAEHGTIPTIFVTGTPDQGFGCDLDRILEKPLSPHEATTLFYARRPH